jgi:hypothetical protein
MIVLLLADMRRAGLGKVYARHVVLMAPMPLARTILILILLVFAGVVALTYVRLPVLVVHGAGGGFDQGLHFGAPLAAKGFQVIAMSRFGYLRTPLPAEASAAAQADGHVCLLWRRRRPWWKTRAPTRRRASTK